MEQQYSSEGGGDNRRSTDWAGAERRASPSIDSEVWVLKTKVDMLTDSLVDIKETLKRIVEIVGVISIIEVNAKQLSKEAASIYLTVQGLQSQLDALEKTFTVSIEEVEDRCMAKIKSLGEKVDTMQAGWNEKYNMLRGGWMVVSALFVFISGGAWMYLKSHIDKFDTTYAWVERQKIEAAVADKEREKRLREYQLTAKPTTPGSLLTP